MPPKTMTAAQSALYNEARGVFNKSHETSREQREEALEDRRFYSIAGAQWEGRFEETFQNRPRLEVNKVHLAVMRVINEYRNNRITVDFIPADGGDDSTADTCDMLYRADEQDSTAEEAYDNAFEEAVGGGIGAWRLVAEYEDEYDDEDDRQRIVFEPIYDADMTVYFDNDAKRQDKSDATWGFVLQPMSPEAYEAEWDDSPASWPVPQVNKNQFDWAPPDVVYVAEAYKVEETKQKVRVFEDLDGERKVLDAELFEEDPNLATKMDAQGDKHLFDKTVKRRKVRKVFMSGNGILEDCGYIAGCEIPIIVTYGKRWYVDNIERFMGHVRLAKDMQRLKNMQLSMLALYSAESTEEKPIFLPEQIAGHEEAWRDKNLEDYAYLTINAITDANGQMVPSGPVGYTKPTNIPPALAALLELSENDMSDLLGKQEAGEEIQPNISGKAIELIQTRLDMQSFIYVSNMKKSMIRSGQVWLSMAKDLFVEEGRVMRGIGKAGEVSGVELKRPMLNDAGETIFENDVSQSNLAVTADVGPSSASRRTSTVRSLMAVMQVTQDPTDRQVLSSMIMMNLEGEGIQEVREYYRAKLITMGAIKPTPEEQKELEEAQANQQPDPQAQYLMAESQKAEAQAQESVAKTGLTVAKTEETKAKTAETLAGIPRDDQKQAVDTATAIGNAIQ